MKNENIEKKKQKKYTLKITKNLGKKTSPKVK